jgi:hypothetical protein
VTRYFCDDVSHWREGEPRTVDVTAQVRLELGYVVDREAFAADVEEVIRRIQLVSTRDRSTRRAEIREILTGTTTPTGAPVRLVEGRAGGAGEVVHLPEAASAVRGGVSTRTDPRTDRGASLTGTFAADELAGRLAEADPTPEALADVIRRTPPSAGRNADEVGHPWRVVVTCPVAEGDPPTEHRVVFAGTGEAERLDVFGIPASNWDLALEATAASDLAPAHGTRRAERLLGSLLAAEIIVAIALVATTWLSGALGMAAREASGWLALAVVLGVGAIAFAAIGLLGPRAPQGNVNDTLVVSGFYASRTEMLWIATVVSIALFAGGLAVAFIGPLGADDGALPVPSVSFTTQGARTSAVLDLAATNVAIDQGVQLTVRAYPTTTSTGTTIGTVASTGTSDGTVTLHDVVGVPTGSRYIAVLVGVDGNGPVSCGPAATGAAGCTLLAVPQGIASTGSTTISTSTATSAASATSAGVVGGVSPSPSVQP